MKRHHFSCLPVNRFLFLTYSDYKPISNVVLLTGREHARFNKSTFVNATVISLYMMTTDVISSTGDMLKIDYKIYIVCEVKFAVPARSFFASTHYPAMNASRHDW
ncbi:hypothetical protein SEES3845_011120 [Salmonella enterica subsp. enterica serovar Senftenberg str. ATCC 43845]|nr:hypothetical protein SEES3845_011120 [Salmonella enterica subsp. enterica serovar Senftenberg str. ATCC 43845]